MRCLAILLLCCLLEQSFCRPQAVTQESYRDAEENEYENEDDLAPEESAQEDEDAAVDEKASNNKDEEEAVQPRRNRNYFFRHRGEGRTVAVERVTKDTNDNFSELSSDRRLDVPEDEAAENEEDQPESNSKQDRGSEPNDANSQFTRESDDQRESGVLRKQQRKGSAEQEENNDMLYENGDTKQEQAEAAKSDKNKRNHDDAEPNGESRFYNQYYNRPQTGTRESQNNPQQEFNHDDANRDRRNANGPNDDGSNGQDAKDKKDLENIENEAEQAIIQRYVKKLNKKEVEELMSTLTEDKKKLLQQIIDNDGTNQAINLNKREITKKAGAVEENNFMDGVQSDSSKISGPLINLNMGDVTSHNNDATGLTTISNEDESSTKIDEKKIERRSTNGNDETVSEKLEIRTVTAASTESLTTKSDAKREININDFNKKEPQESSMTGLQDELYAASLDEDLKQLMNDDAQLHYDYHNPQKRDLSPDTNAEMAQSMQSLEESFSNSNGYEDSGYYGDSNLAPLVRVKRRNNEHAVKKRDAAILPESKVGYVPENEDDDSDEGNEFYDDGFFDRTANFAKSNSRADKGSDSRRRLLKMNAEGNQSVFKRSNDVIGDTMSIGSDTDNVLSGVEGVDENLMYNGGSRKKRAVEKYPKLEPADELTADLFTSTRSSSTDGTNRPDIFGETYNDNEGFGLSSKSYDGELSRIKRIRRQKQHSPNKRPYATETTVE